MAASAAILEAVGPTGHVDLIEGSKVATADAVVAERVVSEAALLTGAIKMEEKREHKRMRTTIFSGLPKKKPPAKIA